MRATYAVGLGAALLFSGAWASRVLSHPDARTWHDDPTEEIVSVGIERRSVAVEPPAVPSSTADRVVPTAPEVRADSEAAGGWAVLLEKIRTDPNPVARQNAVYQLRDTYWEAPSELRHS